MSCRVAITRAGAYEPGLLKTAVRSALDLIGSLGEVVKPRMRVLLKINHLGHHMPETAIHTHPEFLRAVVAIVREITDDVVVADGLDRPGAEAFTSVTQEVCRDLGVELHNFRGAPYRSIARDDYETVGTVPIAQAALDADVIITLPKLKTHMLTLLTSALKNNYGFLPQRLRANYHRMFPHPETFSNLVVDVFQACPPQLAIVDAVVALEGTGPSRGGHPKPLGLVIAGRDCVAVDAVCAAVMGLEPTDVASTRHATRRGAGVADLAKIEVLGESIASVRSPFTLPVNRLLVDAALRRLPMPVMRLIGRMIESLCEHPVVDRKRCVGCGICVEHCPEGVITLTDGKAQINHAKCIACFCCQEFCESDAIAVGRRPVGRLVSLAASLRRSVLRLFRRNRGPT